MVNASNRSGADGGTLRVGDHGQGQAVVGKPGEFPAGVRGLEQDPGRTWKGGRMMKVLLKLFKRRKQELARDKQQADELVKKAREVTLDGENLWMRSEPKSVDDLKTCVIRCVDEDEMRGNHA